MSFLRTSVVAALAMSATLASAQGTSVSVEQRLQQLEAEQAAMKQQLAERDAAIQELKRELARQGGATAPVAGTTPAVPPAVAGSAVPPQAAASGQVQEADRFAGDAGSHAADGRDLGRLRPG